MEQGQGEDHFIIDSAGIGHGKVSGDVGSATSAVLFSICAQKAATLKKPDITVKHEAENFTPYREHGIKSLPADKNKPEKFHRTAVKAMADPELLEQIRIFLDRSGWIEGSAAVSFLAAGEYNANYLVESESGLRVLRINHGSQLGLGDGQIGYEYKVLQALASSGVTPKPLACHRDPEPLGGGALLMGYLPGEALDYRRDLEHAAYIFARVHAVPVPDGLVVQADPVKDIARESEGLLNRFPDHPLKKACREIQSYSDTVLELADRTRSLFAKEKRCLVNTEVNSGNFLISAAGAFLVDWEKAVESYRYQDLGHFLVPTTTLWKSDVLLTADEKIQFLRAYHKKAGLKMDLGELIEKTRMMEKTILLRALSWCYMAWYEYTQTDRPLQNRDTFSKITRYLDDIPWILKSVK
jgi:aminoglycoside phosphotransferase (APT) family kinase protein